MQLEFKIYQPMDYSQLKSDQIVASMLDHLDALYGRALVSVLESLDDSLIEAAYDLGAGMGTILWRIVIPHAMPGIVSGSIVVFMLTLGNYLTPNLMGGKNSLWFTEQIYNQFIASFNWNQGSAFGFLLLALSSLVIWAGLKLTGQKLSRVVR